MIQITVDDKACVSCSLCAEVCPTDVFAFDEEVGVPSVEHPGECFGCLSCSEICPSNCIDHDGLELSVAHHNDPYAMRLAARLGCETEGRFNTPSDTESRDQALQDLGIRLLSVAEVFKRTLGGSLPAVGTIAGRTLARHLPRYRAPESLDEALELAERQFSPAWAFDAAIDGDALTLTVGDCFVREVCQRRSIELGGELCILFYNYLAGYIGSMAGGIRLRLMNADRGCDQCRYEVKTYN